MRRINSAPNSASSAYSPQKETPRSSVAAMSSARRSEIAPQWLRSRRRAGRELSHGRRAPACQSPRLGLPFPKSCQRIEDAAGRLAAELKRVAQPRIREAAASPGAMPPANATVRSATQSLALALGLAGPHRAGMVKARRPRLIGPHLPPEKGPMWVVRGDWLRKRSAAAAHSSAVAAFSAAAKRAERAAGSDAHRSIRWTRPAQEDAGLSLDQRGNAGMFSARLRCDELREGRQDRPAILWNCLCPRFTRAEPILNDSGPESRVGAAAGWRSCGAR